MEDKKKVDDDDAFRGSKQLQENISKIEEKCKSQSENGTHNNEIILKKLADVKADYAAIVKESEAIKEAQKEAAEFFKSHISLACTALMKLQLQEEKNEVPEELVKLEEMLGINNKSTSIDKAEANFVSDLQKISSDTET
ncbi:uncharacterized protein LOC141898806 isoform X1 [Tubulanus polymorphus]|uniref:uncharacterized protein LOC141898806 isoform X1 n=1 Tax=Tubulanus polymorphus TaxID=672921 RepID=UPI003DA6577F